jgi:hypothetical protein
MARESIGWVGWDYLCVVVIAVVIVSVSTAIIESDACSWGWVRQVSAVNGSAVSWPPNKRRMSSKSSVVGSAVKTGGSEWVSVDVRLSASLANMFEAGSNFALFLTEATHVVESGEDALPGHCDSDGSCSGDSEDAIGCVNVCPSRESSIINVVVASGSAQWSEGQRDSEGG